MKKPFKVDPSTVRSKEQLKETKKAAKHGCAWCLPQKNQRSPIIYSLPLVVIRRNVFLKSGRDMYLIIPKRHVRMQELTLKEIGEIFEARCWLIYKLNLKGGGIIHRFGDREFNASSLPDNHYFEMVVIPHGTEPVAETLFKDRSPEKEATRKKRLE
jgi:hypothetical protein